MWSGFLSPGGKEEQVEAAADPAWSPTWSAAVSAGGERCVYSYTIFFGFVHEKKSSFQQV